MQNGHRGYMALWKHMQISNRFKEVMKNKCILELWKKESDAQPYIPDMVKYFKDNGYRISGALVVDVGRN